MLVAKYRDQDRIYLSWDAASWHASKAFIKRVDAINAQRVNPASPAPRVELAPLPSGAQFLNVIESVFSGMARAVIHNSGYDSFNECKRAIATPKKEIDLIKRRLRDAMEHGKAGKT